jgi:hypothetical protein
MASRRHPVLPTLALAAALGTAALATSATVVQAATRSADTHTSVSASSSGMVTSDDWNTMVPAGGRLDAAS